MLDWSDLPLAPIGVRLLETVVEFGDPEAERAHVIAVPQTSIGLVFLEVAWQDGARQHVRRLSFHPSQTRKVPVGPGEIQIRTAPNESYTLRPGLVRYPAVILPDQSLIGQELQIVVQILTTPLESTAEALFVADLHGAEHVPTVDIRLRTNSFRVEESEQQRVEVTRDQDTTTRFTLTALIQGEQTIRIDIIQNGQLIATLQRQIQVLEPPPVEPYGAAGTHFVSYSSVDGQEFALRLADALTAGSPPIGVWLDQRQLRLGEGWDEQIIEAIRSCNSLLFVMTRDSVEDESVCKNEWTNALRYKKPIVPIKLHADAELPFRLATRQFIDFTGAFEPALARLRKYLLQLDLPEGRLQTLKDRLADARRDLRRASDEVTQLRIQDEIAVLEQQIADQQRIIDNPEQAAQQTAQNIQAGLERERQPEKPIACAARTKFINAPPGVAPSYFQNRFVEMDLVGAFLHGEGLRMMIVVGRGGIGKTALVCRVLKSLERGQLPNADGQLSVDGIVYLSGSGSRRITFPNLFADMCQLLPTDLAARLDAVYKNPQASISTKMRSLLAEFPVGCTILLLDYFDNQIDPETLAIRDAEIDEALQALLNEPHHAVKVIITSRIAPRSLMLVQPVRQTLLDIDQGLASPYAENILRQMDADGRVGLRDAPEAMLSEARERTRGYPRALEALFAILAADRDTALRELLDNTATLLPENVVQALVGEAFSRLDPTAQQVMQALAVYARPVTPTAVDYLLQLYMPGVNSAPVLGRLVNMQFARREAGRYFLHPVDCAYALARVPRGEASDRDVTGAPPFSQFALLHRAAGYFQHARTPRESWKTLGDLEPQLNEFYLHYDGEDYDTAASVLLEIDFDYLLLWGHYRLVAELHERIQGKLNDPRLQQQSIGSLGFAYSQMGCYRCSGLLLES